ncbi:MAG: purine-nucleoside phosphorylase, partial [Micrococcales bacterium]
MKTDQTIASDEINSAPSVEETARAAADVIAERSGVARHDIALVLGSGWAGAADILGEEVYSIPAPQVPGFRPPALEGHVGTLRSIRIGETGRHALVLGARTHLYEGHGVDAVAHGVRTAAAAGCRVLVLTNGAGGLDPEHGQGSVYVLRDHINLTGATPLRGATFIDMTDLYSPRLRDIARRVEPELVDGVYVAMHGPQFETPAEVRMAGILGGDLVGMSTALEAIAARASAMEVLGLSLVTNLAS